MKFKITPFLSSERFTLELYEFVPKDGFEGFLRELCNFSGEPFIDWHQGVESGIGHIFYLEKALTVIWTDFPESLSFDCESYVKAVSLQSLLENFMKSQHNQH